MPTACRRAAMSPAVRSLVRQRSRYEFDNNSWYSGILRTAANHIIGCGPRLQVLTTNADANTRLEKAWMKWSRQVMLADKLRMMFETYWKDGEVFVMRTSRPSRWPTSLDLRTFEAEQCAAPWFGHRLSDPYVDDGVRTDPNNNEVEYHFYRHHPGDVAFTPVESLRNLEALYLNDTGITDEALGQLNAMPGLHYIELSGTSVTDAGVAKLKKDIAAV